MEENRFELVLCIVNAGFSQNVMEAARTAGAKGGTILRARGSANPEAEEFFNINIQPDKEMVMILVGDAQGIAFSLPVNRTTTIMKAGPDEPKEKA